MTADEFHKWIVFRPHSSTTGTETKTYYDYHNGFCFVAIVRSVERRKYIMLDENNIAILIYIRKYIGEGEGFRFRNEWIKEPSDIDLVKLRLAL